MKGYLQTCKHLLSVSPDYAAVFTLFNTECYQTFYREILPLKRYDGMWVA
jgi:hypothetical protein